MTAEKPPRGARADYPVFVDITTRWLDNDVYGHVNNVVYYAFFDTVVNQHLINNGVLDIHAGEQIGLVVETGCRFYASIAFPARVQGGLRVAHVGNTSVRYEVGLFEEGGTEPVAEGHFVHVYVDRETRRPTPIGDELRAVLEGLHVGA
ncbi:MAG: thioesterase family protein [Maricaulaceae bacterium]